jgi:hypothetical protein
MIIFLFNWPKNSQLLPSKEDEIANGSKSFGDQLHSVHPATAELFGSHVTFELPLRVQKPLAQWTHLPSIVQGEMVYEILDVTEELAAHVAMHDVME